MAQTLEEIKSKVYRKRPVSPPYLKVPISAKVSA